MTRWIKHEQLPQVLTWLEGEIQKGSQAYVISPLIEESEALDLKNAIALSEELTAHFAGKAEVALLHGKMKSDEKDQIMQEFKERKTDILVSTTVIEVGGQCSQCDRYDYHGCGSLRAQPASPAQRSCWSGR